ncbi:TetR/AcrR family transcriptional regulator [Nonomuraea deserti]|uniref:TetR/AcrR family transcriptional regulator n=1 Tax=Nonomuraea deserti TaxID=1848322 RepID=A0A4R4VII0_9ACTN|nr:TetR/AcrR family transcriptional regulator [Nonomuraea deserti]
MRCLKGRTGNTYDASSGGVDTLAYSAGVSETQPTPQPGTTTQGRPRRPEPSGQAASATRALRSDAERTVRTILEAAERVLSKNPAATMEQIAEAAGVARTTVHRRFASREALVDAMAAWATRQFAAAVDAASPENTPPLVALYQVTANVLRVKSDWGFAMSRALSADPEVARVHADVEQRCTRLFERARSAGVLRADVDYVWAKRAYYALIHETVRSRDGDPDTLAVRLVDTLLRGLGTGQSLT